MISNIAYTFSVFSDCSMLVYNKKDVISILERFDDIDLSPINIQELQPLGVTSQRMQFIAHNGLLIITIGSERIDIQITSDRKEGFTDDEVIKCKNDMELYMGKLFDIFSERVALPYRLAWFTSYIYFNQSSEEKNNFRDKFLKDINYFNERRLDDMIARYGANRNFNIASVEEKVNVIFTVNRHIVNKGSDMEIDGYKVDFDINTWQENRVGRFEKNVFNEFLQQAYDEQQKLRKEILQ